MVTPGTDSHKAPHTFVATDDTGRELGQATFSADPDGHLKALRWSSKWPERCWALEDCRHLSRRLERDLLGAGEIPRPKPSGPFGVESRTRFTAGSGRTNI